MSVKCNVIIEAMNRLAPTSLAYPWDNVGLLVGDSQQEIHKVLISLDVTETVVDEACKVGAEMIITHHPFIFKEFKKLPIESAFGRVLCKIIKQDMAIFAAHTNFDLAWGGVNDILADKLGLKNIKPLEKSGSEKLFKLVVFVPKSHETLIREVLGSYEAGAIGNYSHCTFTTEGIGSFMPSAGTHPFIGQIGKIEHVKECRIETIICESKMQKTIGAMLAVHPYEEVAYDIYPLGNSGSDFGLGRIGSLEQEISLADFINRIKPALLLHSVTVAGDLSKPIAKVAVCGGSGAALINIAAQMGADVLVTGDIKYHEAQQALDLGIAVVDASHFATEQPAVLAIAQYLSAQNMSIEVMTGTVHKNVLQIC